jgi:hypothetical protein
VNTPYRLTLTEEAFRELVSGKTVLASIHHVRVEVVLADIGWARMACALLEGLAGPQPLPPDPPEAREFLPRRTRRP